MGQFEFAFQVLFIGIFVVMFTLFLLYAILLVFAHLFQKKEKPFIEKTPANEASFVKPEVGGPDQRLTVAIIAAVYQYMGVNSYSFKPAVVNISVQPSSGNCDNKWQVIGRKLLLENKMGLDNIRRSKTT